ncbi:fibronectin type III domain-containing protein 9 [Protopterus annectens]|uniref:fibronectin type III domain-containing protein 9 n=1 Tax=Protopterus annectens TaxID=7888 RepID=UPI001CF96F51|nr:fibronectin type III domain-containing protein 9 [Protopterus annectens]
MNIEVHKTSYTSSTISWSANYKCPENYYRIMYRPNWNSVFSGYSHQSFHHEEKVPHSQNTFTLHRLTPSTVYILCITCKNVYPTGDHCTTFHTMEKTPLTYNKLKLDTVTTVSAVSSLLLICFSAILLYTCLQFWFSECQRWPKQYNTTQQDETCDHQAWLEGPLEAVFTGDQYEVPLNSILCREMNHVMNSPQHLPHYFFPHKSSDEKKAILPQNICK